jgi:hypothetical protein
MHPQAGYSVALSASLTMKVSEAAAAAEPKPYFSMLVPVKAAEAAGAVRSRLW